MRRRAQRGYHGAGHGRGRGVVLPGHQPAIDLDVRRFAVHGMEHAAARADGRADQERELLEVGRACCSCSSGNPLTRLPAIR